MNILKNLSRGFTLIELLIVVAIIGILASMIIANVSGSRSKASDAKIKSDLNQLKTAMQIYYNDHQAFPPVSGSNFTGCPDIAACAPGSVFSSDDGTSIYMKEVPSYEVYTLSGDSYEVCMSLENTSDPDIATSQTKCGAAGAGQYCTCND